MRKIFLMSLAILLIQAANAASVECVKERGRWYPKNDTAKKIARMLGVKTCSGHRFKTVVAKMGLKSNVVAGKRSMSVEDTIRALKAGK